MFSPLDDMTSHSVLKLMKCDNINSYDHSLTHNFWHCIRHWGSNDEQERYILYTVGFPG